jgi:hypothetical protein
LSYIEYKNGNYYYDGKRFLIWRRGSSGERIERYYTSDEFHEMKRAALQDISEWELEFGKITDIIAL